MRDEIQERINKSVSNLNPRNIYTIGCGTSFNSCQSVSYTLQKLLQIPSIAFNAHDYLLETPPGLGEGSLVISISESGQSITTCQSQEKSREMGAFTVGISANQNSRLATGANLALTDPFLHELPLGKTRTFLSTAYLGMLAGLMTGGFNHATSFIGLMKDTISILRENMALLEESGKLIAAEVGQHAGRYFTTGFGCQKPVSDEITLKLIEVVGESSTSFGLEEFSHGPSATFRKDLGVILFQTDPRTLEKSVRIAHGVAISKACLVVITDSPDSNWPENARVLSLPETQYPEIFGQFTSTVAAQYLFYYLALQKGLNPDVNSEDIHPELGDIYAFFFPPGTH